MPGQIRIGLAGKLASQCGGLLALLKSDILVHLGEGRSSASKASLLIACIENDADLVAAQVSAAATRLPLWCVYPKGKAVNPGDGAIRSALRGAGWIDTKTCAVSERLTATRYARR